MCQIRGIFLVPVKDKHSTISHQFYLQQMLYEDQQ